jgi:putative transposase
MAVWRRKPKTKVQVHSDQGSQFTNYEWQEFLKQHNLTQSMSRRGNCWDNAVAESFFNLLKRERIRRRKYKTREEARQDVFALRRLQTIAYRPVDYIEFFYNPQRKHVRNGMLLPIAFEQQQKLKRQGVKQTRGYSLKQGDYPAFAKDQEWIKSLRCVKFKGPVFERRRRYNLQKPLPSPTKGCVEVLGFGNPMPPGANRCFRRYCSKDLSWSRKWTLTHSLPGGGGRGAASAPISRPSPTD